MATQSPVEMTFRQHFALLLQAVSVWLVFWIIGLPAYYQQYSTVTMALVCALLSSVMPLGALLVLRRGRSETRIRLAFWYSVYYTLPFAFLDVLYCGIYLGHGHEYVTKYWYLSIFYVTPWLTFMPTAALLHRRATADR
jgi:hypothetical protein